jgi:hypothetical protein
MAAIGIGIKDDTGRVDIRATYGGMVFGAALLFAWAALEVERYEAGLYAMIFIYGGLGLARLLAIVLGARPKRILWIFLGVEALYAGLAVVPLV